jgi:hypothetical protein
MIDRDQTLDIFISDVISGFVRGAGEDSMTKLIRAASAAVLLSLGVPVLADIVTWDGHSSSDASGNWSNADNWDAGLPDSLDDVTFPSVTTGTRTITQDIAGGTTIGSLAIQQSGTVGVNRLSLSGDLTLFDASRENATVDSATSALRLTLSGSATPSQFQLDLNGHAVMFATSGSGATTGGNLAGTVNYATAGSAIMSVHAGHTGLNVFGTLNVTADGFLGRDTGGVSSSGNLNIAVQAAGSIVVSNNAVFTAAIAGRLGQNRSMTFTNNGSVSIASGSVLRTAIDALTSSGATNGFSVNVNNGTTGTFTHGGDLSVRAFQGATSVNPTVIAITNNGTWAVSGTAATLTRQTTSTTSGTPAVIVPTFTVSSTGLVRGSGTLDALEYNEQQSTGGRLTITNNGQISAGNGSNGAGTSSIGTLDLRDINLTFGTTGRLNIDIADGNRRDRVRLLGGQTDSTGAGTLDLSAAGDRLNITLVDGFIPGIKPFQAQIMTFGSVVLNADTTNGLVGFDVLAIGPNTQNGPVFNGPNDSRYWLTYDNNTVTLNYIPEPSALSMVLIATAGLLRRRRR